MGVLPAADAFGTSVQFDSHLVRKFNQQGPRYTSYPTADRFTNEFRSGDYLQAVSDVRTLGARKPLSLYVHIPFCESLCYYCGRNKIVTRTHSRASTYLAYLTREIRMQAVLFEGMNQVAQLHFGGGTPTFLSDSQMGSLVDQLRRSFSFASDAQGEYAIEIDPRTVTPARIHTLRQQGFNRISLGVQDFDEAVQKAVNRVQPEQMILSAIAAARHAGFRSISIDLIYGLPKQNLISMARTLARVIAADPDRISLYSYAHMPSLFKSQRLIADDELPGAQTRLDMLGLCIRRLTEAGYVYIGMDHFAKPDDELAVAQRQGRLQRNIQGYSTHAEAEMVSLGVSAISAVGGTYSQNEKSLPQYYECIERGQLPVARGIRLSTDDALRRIIIQMLMCSFELSMSALEMAHPIVFADYFGKELGKLREYEADGMLTIGSDWITVSARGRLLIRNICMVFDRYLDAGHAVKRMPYSRTI